MTYEERLRITIKAITMDRFTELMSKLLDKRSGDLIRVREISRRRSLMTVRRSRRSL